MARNDHKRASYRLMQLAKNYNTRQLRNEDVKLKREWPTPKRIRVKDLFNEGHTRNEIYKRTNVPVRTQRTFTNMPDRRPGAYRPGRPRRLEIRTIRQIIRYISSDFKSRTSTWQELAELFTDEVHPSTVKKELNRWGYYKCKACQKSWIRDENVRQRWHFAKLWKRLPAWWWKRVRFTDEVHFSVESRRAEMVIRDSTERFCESCTQYKKRGGGSQVHA